MPRITNTPKHLWEFEQQLVEGQVLVAAPLLRVDERLDQRRIDRVGAPGRRAAHGACFWRVLLACWRRGAKAVGAVK
jgi:hypothetical protein